MRIGFHIPFSGNFNKLKEKLIINRGNTFQIYARSLRGVDKNGVPHELHDLKGKKTKDFFQFLYDKNISPIIVHAPYSHNLVQDKVINKLGEEVDQKNLLLEDLEWSRKLGAKYYVLQPGYSKGVHPILAIENLKLNLMEVLEKTDWEGEILIKNMSGAGSELASSFEEWNELISFHPRIKGALDFSRAFSAGYSFMNEEDAKKFYETVEELVSWDKVRMVYINDNDRFCGSKKNIFPPLGEGVINHFGYENILSYEKVKEKIWIVENQPTLEYVDRNIAFLTDFFAK